MRKLRRRGWRVVNHVTLRAWDIDRVLIGPGGAFAVETKWSSHEWELVPPRERVRAAVRQAQGNARSLRLWQPFMAAGIPVHPLVMLWGGGPSTSAWKDVTRESRANGWRLARNVLMDLPDAGRRIRFLITDRDARITPAFDAMFTSMDVDMIKIPGGYPWRTRSVNGSWTVSAESCWTGS